jgi:hypothetical protein
MSEFKTRRELDMQAQQQGVFRVGAAMLYLGVGLIAFCMCVPDYAPFAPLGAIFLQLGFLTLSIVAIDYDDFYRIHRTRFIGFLSMTCGVSFGLASLVAYSFMPSAAERVLAMTVWIVTDCKNSTWPAPSDHFFSWFVGILSGFIVQSIRSDAVEAVKFSLGTNLVRVAIPVAGIACMVGVRRQYLSKQETMRCQANMVSAYPFFISVGLWCLWFGTSLLREGDSDDFCAAYPEASPCVAANNDVGRNLESSSGVLTFIGLGIAVILPTTLFWKYKSNIWGRASRIFELQHRVQDGYVGDGNTSVRSQYGCLKIERNSDLPLQA